METEKHVNNYLFFFIIIILNCFKGILIEKLNMDRKIAWRILTWFILYFRIYNNLLVRWNKLSRRKKK